MSQVPVWFERKFEFSFPVEFYPNLATRLRGTPARMEETLNGRAQEILVRKEPGKWSAQEHAGHLVGVRCKGVASRIEEIRPRFGLHRNLVADAGAEPAQRQGGAFGDG